ncbi:MAG: hypothetical protein H7096_00185 [Flavobacterium sp.]|nr:hypothetical protein [Pedobacter sp.]
MLSIQIAPIKNWIEVMGFELVTSHTLKNAILNYYSLGNFGVYEEILTSENASAQEDLNGIKYISWNPWGDDFEVNSVEDLNQAYEDTLSINP